MIGVFTEHSTLSTSITSSRGTRLTRGMHLEVAFSVLQVTEPRQPFMFNTLPDTVMPQLLTVRVI